MHDRIPPPPKINVVDVVGRSEIKLQNFALAESSTLKFGGRGVVLVWHGKNILRLPSRMWDFRCKRASVGVPSRMWDFRCKCSSALWLQRLRFGLGFPMRPSPALWACLFGCGKTEIVSGRTHALKLTDEASRRTADVKYSSHA